METKKFCILTVVILFISIGFFLMLVDETGVLISFGLTLPIFQFLFHVLFSISENNGGYAEG